MKILVTPPFGTKIINSIDSVLLESLFLQDYFWLDIDKENLLLKFEINLPEWLLEFTNFLKVPTDNAYDEQLLLSGEHFVAERKSGDIRIRVFDHHTMQKQWLSLTKIEAEMLHSKLVCELIEAVNLSAGKSLPIRDIERLEIGSLV